MGAVSTVAALAALGVTLVAMGMTISSQLAWQESGSESGPINETVPGRSAYAFGGMGGPGPLALTERVIAAWSTSTNASQLQFEVLILRPGGSPGVLNSTELGNATVVSVSEWPPNSADVTYTANYAGPYLLTDALVNPGPTPVTVTSFLAVFEYPNYPSSQLGESVQAAGFVVVALAACYVIAVAAGARRRAKPVEG